jgi:hypothetical protein
LHYFEELIEDQGEVAVILDLNPATQSYTISQYAIIHQTTSVPSSTIVSHLYLSQCTNTPMLVHLSSTDSSVFIPANNTDVATLCSIFKEQPMIVT